MATGRSFPACWRNLVTSAQPAAQRLRAEKAEEKKLIAGLGRPRPAGEVPAPPLVQEVVEPTLVEPEQAQAPGREEVGA